MQQGRPLGRLLYDQQFWWAILVAPLVLLLISLIAPELPFVIEPTYRQLALFLILAPLLEELAFRGWLQGYFWRTRLARQRVGNISAANIATSALFALSHTYSGPLLWSLLVFFPSLVFGYHRDRYQSVFPAFVLHLVYNACWLTWLLCSGLNS
ncbi:JDVT-CTERM system glutamic-type intramembrane protease MrtJ [Spongiibacter marinus]|uniref:JDVT-CTERM system glutamic-type intramembrane protease MrtJ n=1 Tax=Spongiibacter marinus TaxID=354246 RepID=UPI0035692871